MQKAAIFFLKNCTPLCAYVYQKMPHEPSIYLTEQRGQCLDNRCDQRAISLTTSSLEAAPIEIPVGVDIALEIEVLQALYSACINC